MTDPRPARTAAADARAARVVLLDPSKIAGSLQPKSPLGFAELVHYGEFVGWHAGRDFVLRAEAIIAASVASDRPLDEELTRTILRAIDAPSARTLRRVELFLDSKAVRLAIAPQIQALTDALVVVIPFHRSAYGCPQASSTCAALCMDAAVDDLAIGRPGAGIRALKAAALFAQDAHVDGREKPYVSTPRYPRLQALSDLATEWLPAITACAAAERMVQDEDDVLRGGVGVPAEPGHALDLEDVLWGAAEKAAEKAVESAPEPPALVVLAEKGVDHLPGSSDSGKSGRASYTSTSPRTVWEPWAGRAVPLVHGVDVAAATATLVAEFPWAEDQIRVILADLVGAPFVRLRPTLLAGKPGCVKSRLARRIGEVLGLPVLLFSAAGASDASFGGTSRQWSTGRNSTPASAILQHQVANPLIAMDEIDKIGESNQNGNLSSILVTLFEKETSSRYFDPFIDAPLDLSAVSYVATANDARKVPQVVLDRLRLLTVPEPRRQDLPAITRQITAAFRADRGMDATWCSDLAPDELDLLSQHWKGGSIRTLARLTEALLSGREALATRN